ncbi:MAG TPA: hypothetical protein VF796_29360 [Humisphaera sp.]
MTTLQNQPKSTRSTFDNSQAGDTSESSYQSQQESRNQRPQNDRQQSGQEEETFTVSTDDWFKA